MAEGNSGKIAQPGAKFPHTCFLYSPIKPSTSNNPFIAFLPETGRAEGGTVGGFKSGRETRRELLTTKHMAWMDFWPLLERALYDIRHGRVDSGLSAFECAKQRLRDFDVAKETEENEYGREMSEIFLVTVENEFPDRLVVKQAEPGSGCVVC
jgi:hypothetical protein